MSYIRPGVAFEYITATNYNGVAADLVKKSDTDISISYTLSLFNGTGFDVNKVRSVVMLITADGGTAGSDDGSRSQIIFTDPAIYDDTAAEAQAATWSAAYRSDGSGHHTHTSSLQIFPLAKGQINLAYDMHQVYVQYTYRWLRTKILGFQQVT